jgi:hypothetical protein
LPKPSTLKNATPKASSIGSATKISRPIASGARKAYAASASRRRLVIGFFSRTAVNRGGLDGGALVVVVM